MESFTVAARENNLKEVEFGWMSLTKNEVPPGLSGKLTEPGQCSVFVVRAGEVSRFIPVPELKMDLSILLTKFITQTFQYTKSVGKDTNCEQNFEENKCSLKSNP